MESYPWLWHGNISVVMQNQGIESSWKRNDNVFRGGNPTQPVRVSSRTCFETNCCDQGTRFLGFAEHNCSTILIVNTHTMQLEGSGRSNNKHRRCNFVLFYVGFTCRKRWYPKERLGNSIQFPTGLFQRETYVGRI